MSVSGKTSFKYWSARLIKISGLIALLFLSLVTAATQATFYVSPDGDDSNSGSESAPFKTIIAARDAVRTINKSMTGDIIVYLREGTHCVSSTITFKPEDSGKNGYRIIYQAFPGEKPVVSGSVSVTGWTLHSGNIYKATLNRSTKLRNLYVNDKRALMTKKTVTARGGQGTYSVTAGQADWAWTSGSKSDGVKYNISDIPSITNNKDDIEIVNGTTWNENIVCVRDVITTSDDYRVLLLQQPYGAIAQTPGWGAAFSTTGTHTIYNVFDYLDSPGQFYFDKTDKILYYYIRQGEDMSTADVQVPIVEKLINIAGTSPASRVKNVVFKGITFANTEFNLVKIADSHGKSTCQGANAFIAFYNDNWHNTEYDLLDVHPGMITVNNSDSIDFLDNIIKHSGSDGINMANDVVNCNIIGNYITDITSSGITIGHPQHVYIGDGGAHSKYASDVEDICKNNTISNNILYDISTAPGFGGCAAITAYFVEGLTITHNIVQETAYNGIHLGWGWCNFFKSNTCKNNTISNNRIINVLRRLHDSGAIYTIGQMPGTNINQNYVRGIPAATSGPTYGLHNDEGTAYVIENDNILDIDPEIKYTINCEDYGQKHDLTILRTYATVNKMGKNPPDSKIDVPVVVSDNVWPLAQYTICVNSGIQDTYRKIIPDGLISRQNYVFPASCAATAGAVIPVRSSGDSSNSIWFAPSGTSSFIEQPSMTKATGISTSISAPSKNGIYKLFIVNSVGAILGESSAQLRVSGGASSKIEAEDFSDKSGIETEDCSEGGLDVGYIEDGDQTVYDNVNFGSNGSSICSFRVGCNSDGGKIEIRIDSSNGTLIGTCPISSTGGWQTYKTETCAITRVTGIHKLYLKFTGGAGYLFNINWFEFSDGATATVANTGIRSVNSFKTARFAGKLIIYQYGTATNYSLLMFNLNGRLLRRYSNIIGKVEIPIRSKGIYLLVLNCNGQIKKETVNCF